MFKSLCQILTFLHINALEIGHLLTVVTRLKNDATFFQVSGHMFAFPEVQRSIVYISART